MHRVNVSSELLDTHDTCSHDLETAILLLQPFLLSQIHAIRSEMDIEVNRLVAIIHKKNGDLTELETKLVKRLRWGIVVLQTKNENIVRRQVLTWWR